MYRFRPCSKRGEKKVFLYKEKKETKPILVTSLTRKGDRTCVFLFLFLLFDKNTYVHGLAKRVQKQATNKTDGGWTEYTVRTEYIRVFRNIFVTEAKNDGRDGRTRE